MGLRFPDQTYGDCFFITTTFREWQRLGDLPGFYGQMAESLHFCLNKYEAQLAGYVFMPSHLHLVLFIVGNRLSDFMRDFKKYVSQKVAVDRGMTAGIWMPRYDRVVISSEKVMRTKLEYMHQNPVGAGLIAAAIEWNWSSAGDYLTDKPGLLPIWKSWA